MTRTRSVRLAALAVLFVGSAAVGDVIRVPEDQPTIQAGIDAATDGDEVVIGDGTWTGPDNTNLDFGGRVITVRSANGPGACTIDGENDVGTRAFIFQNEEPADARVEGLTIRRCLVEGDNGGAIRCFLSAAPTIEDCVFTGNSAADGQGGAIYGTGFSVIDCVFQGNVARWGGALWGDRCTVRGSTFEQNLASSGGAVYAGSNVVIEQSSFRNNLAVDVSAAQGGAITVVASVEIAACTFDDNTARAIPANATAYGGAIYGADAGPFNVRDSVFRRNRAVVDGAGEQAQAAGGAIYSLLNGSLDLFGNLFEDNLASAFGRARGGAVFFSQGIRFRTVNCTFNDSDLQSLGEEAGRTLWLSLILEDEPFHLQNTVIWDDESVGGRIAVGGSSPDPTVEYCNIKGGWPGSGNLNADPMFVDEPGGDLRLAPGSPCIDAASNAAVPPERTVDLDGNPRFVDDPDTPDTGQGAPPVVDIGAYEFQAGGCPADLDASGDVGFDDLLMLLNAWGKCDACPEDLDGSGDVGFDDLLMLLAAWGPC